MFIKKNTFRIRFVFFLSALTPVWSYSQVVINEVCSANDQLYPDEDGDCEDWIELYNPTGTTVDLTNYKFTYTEGSKVTEWIFPPLFINPYAHLTIYASEKNRSAVIDHWELPVYADNVWKYQANATAPPDTSWYQPGFNDAAWLSGIGGIGYGDGDDNTTVPVCYSLFTRKSFNVTDTSRHPVGFLMIDYDDSFVAWLNGVEIARSNVGIYGDHPAYDVSAYGDHEAHLYWGGEFEFYLVPKPVLSAALKPGTNVLSIQVNNYSGGMDDLSMIPYLVLGASDTTSAFISFPADFSTHANFSLASAGFSLSLSNPSGTIIDSQTFGPIKVNNSRGRSTDGGSTFCTFFYPTPKDTNDVSPCFSNYVTEPSFSIDAGFYTGTQTVSINVPPGCVVFYTTNGNEPWYTTAPVYTAPITISSTTVLRARAFDPMGLSLPSSTVTNTYFINENIASRVISVSTDSSNLWDWNTGIYVMGPDADPAIPYINANFWKGWKKQSHTEFFSLDHQQGFELDGALSIHGNYSKAWPQKSFRVSANDDYGDAFINYQLFPSKNINKFRSFNIRNAGIDWNTCHFRDRLMHKMVEKCDIDIMAGEPATLFLNGQYWGMYEMRERQDEYYIAENHNIDPDNVDLLRFEGDILNGTNADFLDMVDFIGGSDLTIQSNYDSALSLIDLDNYCDYFIAETYYNNSDWIWTDDVAHAQGTNNIKFWRRHEPASKWRYILWDTDLGLALFDGAAAHCPYGLLNQIIDPSVIYASKHVQMLRSFLANTDFKNYFINRYCDLMNTAFHPTPFASTAYAMRDELEPEMARHFSKWNETITIFGIWDVGRSNNVTEWHNEVDAMVDFINCRPYYVRDSLQSEFDLVKQVTVGLNTSPAGAGTIQLNTITPETLPWNGVYFDGVPVTMTASPAPGYKFLYWKSDNLVAEYKNASMTINVSTDDNFTAYFQELVYSFNAYPSPFTDALTLEFELVDDMRVTANLYDVVGRQVTTLLSGNEWQTPGNHKVTVNTKQLMLPDGVYFVKFTASDMEHVVKVVKSKL
ncbi:MAG TPA: CotH kinase family protein [Flavobacteriales bacterium]|nr:CotH kinase family protein [Flavobacteriales bacterium]